MPSAQTVRHAIILAAVFATLSTAGCATQRAEPATSAGLIFERTRAPERLAYVVYVPRDYTPDRAWPCIVFLHGSGESGTDGQKQIAQGIGTNILWNAARWPAIVIMPQKPSSQVLWDKHTGAVMSALADVKARYRIDPDRTALTGLSQGGHGVWTIGAAHPEVWSALAPVCGFVDSNRASGDAAAIAAKVKDIPVWAFHGQADDVVLPAQTERMVEALKAAGSQPKLTLYPGVNHGSWDRAYAEAELPAFLMQPRRR